MCRALVGVGGPRNNFRFDTTSDCLFVAGGIGIASLLPMLRAADAAGVNWRLLYGGRTRSSMAFADGLATGHPDRVEIRPQDACRARIGITLHVERFAAKERSADAVDGTFEVELARSGVGITVGADESLLDAVLRSGVDVPFSCQEGTCGTCEVAVMHGEPDHRDSVLTEDEQAVNDCMMICVSRSRTPKLVLEL